MNVFQDVQVFNAIPAVQLDYTIPFPELLGFLNEGFQREFTANNLPESVLYEFVYAIDHLDELVRMVNFPVGRLINTKDIDRYGKSAVEAFNLFARRKKDRSMYGVIINDKATNSVEEFFNYRYIENLIRLVQAFKRDSIMFTIEFSYQVQVKQSVHPDFGILIFNDYTNGLETIIPFLWSKVNT